MAVGTFRNLFFVKFKKFFFLNGPRLNGTAIIIIIIFFAASLRFIFETTHLND